MIHCVTNALSEVLEKESQDFFRVFSEMVSVRVSIHKLNIVVNFIVFNNIKNKKADCRKLIYWLISIIYCQSRHIFPLAHMHWIKLFNIRVLE